MAKAVKIAANGMLSIVPIGEDPNTTTLDEFQACVGGLIEPVTLNNGYTMYVNEEGLIRGYRPNPLAMNYANNNSNYSAWYLVGDAVLIGPEDEHGNFADAPKFILDLVEEGVFEG